MGTESVTTRGALIGPLESTLSLFSFLSNRTDRTSVSSLASQMEYLPIIEITSSSWNPADLRMFGPHMESTRVFDCISSARRDTGYMGSIDSTVVG